MRDSRECGRAEHQARRTLSKSCWYASCLDKSARRRERASMAFVKGSMLLVAMALLSGNVLAQSYPTKPVRIVVPYTPGGTVDIVARLIAERLAESLGRTFLIDNRPGAAGNLGAELVAKAPPDGYTLLMSSAASLASNPAFF